MSSHYSLGDVSADVESLVQRLLKKYPTLMFTSSAVAQELPYDESQVRRALYLEAERGLLEPLIYWRCEECDSPSIYPISDEHPVGTCRTCEGDRRFDQFLYFKAADALLSRLQEADDGGEAPKKVAAATEEEPDRIAAASSSPQRSDIANSDDRDILIRIARGVERNAVANEQTARSSAITASDPTPKRTLKWTVIGIGATVLVSLFIWWATDYHLLNRLGITAEFASPTAPARSQARAKVHDPHT